MALFGIGFLFLAEEKAKIETTITEYTALLEKAIANGASKDEVAYLKTKIDNAQKELSLLA